MSESMVFADARSQESGENVQQAEGDTLKAGVLLAYALLKKIRELAQKYESKEGKFTILFDGKPVVSGIVKDDQFTLDNLDYSGEEIEGFSLENKAINQPKLTKSNQTIDQSNTKSVKQDLSHSKPIIKEPVNQVNKLRIIINQQELNLSPEEQEELTKLIKDFLENNRQNQPVQNQENKTNKLDNFHQSSPKVTGAIDSKSLRKNQDLPTNFKNALTILETAKSVVEQYGEQHGNNTLVAEGKNYRIELNHTHSDNRALVVISKDTNQTILSATKDRASFSFSQKDLHNFQQTQKKLQLQQEHSQHDR